MTGNGMKASLQRIESRVSLVTALLLAASLSGCMTYDPFNQAIDATSPAAMRTEALTRTDLAYPRWEDFPAAPQNVPTTTDIRNRVVGLETAELQLGREVSALQWTLTPDDAEPWAERTRNRVDLRLARPIDAEAAAAASAWAQRMRERAEPPPPIRY